MRKKTEQTLAEQLQLSAREIDIRKQLLDFDTEDVRLLKGCHEEISRKLDDIVDRFYEKQTQVPEISLLIGDAETLHRLRQAMGRYILELFEGFYDENYVNRRLRIGKVHKRIGVSPKLYISAIRLLQHMLSEEIGTIAKGDEITATKNSLNKLMMFDTQLVFDTYIASLVSEVEAAHNELEEYAASLEETVAERTRQLELMSRQDGLTGLYNQRSFYEQLRHEQAAAERRNETLCLVYFDLNGFKQLNDTEGHRAGDEVLTTVGRVLLEQMRETDICCRYGGDEFCVLMPNTGIDDALQSCERLVQRFENEDMRGVSFSIGIAQDGPDKFRDMNALVKEADQRMYASKMLSREKPGYHITAE